MSLSKIIPAKIFPILLVNFIGILGYSIVIPILIFIVADYGGNGFVYGILGAMYPFFQFIERLFSVGFLIGLVEKGSWSLVNSELLWPGSYSYWPFCFRRPHFGRKKANLQAVI